MKRIMVLMVVIGALFVMYACGSGGVKFFGLNNISSPSSGEPGASVEGRVSNTFGTPLGRDIDGDGDNDAAVILHNIAGGNHSDVGNSIFVDQDGKVYVTGTSIGNGTDYDLIVTRLNGDGTVDTSFSQDGHVVLNGLAAENNSDIVDKGYSIFVDQGGKIYVTGYSYNGPDVFSSDQDLVVVKLKPDGNLDTTFDADGIAVFSNIAGGNDRDIGYSIYVHSNKIYVTGFSFGSVTSSDLIVMRLEDNGTLDSTFGVNGKRILHNIAGGNGPDVPDVGKSIYVAQDGKVYVTGVSKGSGIYSDLIVVRLDNNGNLDSSFDGDGKVVISNIASPNNDVRDVGASIYVDQSGKVYVTGYSYNGSDMDMVIIRLNNNGSLDTTFDAGGNSDGIVVLDDIAGEISDDIGKSIYVDQGGRIYVTGSSWNGSDNDLVVLRLNSDGTLDSTFGRGGKLVIKNITSSQNSNEEGYSMYVDQSGNIYVTGYSRYTLDSSGNDLIVLKIE